MRGLGLKSGLVRLTIPGHRPGIVLLRGRTNPLADFKPLLESTRLTACWAVRLRSGNSPYRRQDDANHGGEGEDFPSPV
jgi:hypothetical protein